MLSIIKSIGTVIFFFIYLVTTMIAMAAYMAFEEGNYIGEKYQAIIFFAKIFVISTLSYICAFLLRKRYPDTPNKDAIQTKQWYLLFYVVFVFLFEIPFISYIHLVRDALGYLLSNYGKLSLLPIAALGIYLFKYGASKIWRCPSCNEKLHFLGDTGGTKVTSCHKCGVSFDNT